MRFTFFVRELARPAYVPAGSLMWLEDHVFDDLRKTEPSALLDVTPRPIYLAVRAGYGQQVGARRESAATLVACIACMKQGDHGLWVPKAPMLGCEVCRGDRVRVDLAIDKEVQRRAAVTYLAGVRELIRGWVKAGNSATPSNPPEPGQVSAP